MNNLPLRSADEHVFRHRQVGAQGDFLIHGADARVLRVLGGMDVGFPLDPVHVDAAAVLFMHAGEHLDQGGFARAVFAHQGVNLAPAQGEIHVVQRLRARKLLADSAHGQNRVVLHLGTLLFF